MIPMWQLVIGIGFGLVTAFFLQKQRLHYEAHGSGRDSGRDSGDCGGGSSGGNTGSRPRNRGAGAANDSARFNSKPGDSCVICLTEMQNDDMKYMRCGHALHDHCYRSCRRHTKQCPICRMTME